MLPQVEVFVLNYNGADLLRECLPSIIQACKKTSYPCKLTVIDNQSHDNSLEVLREEFKDIHVYVAPKNDVLCSFNAAVAASPADIVLLLNNDLKAEEDFIDPLVRVFERETAAFLASPKAFTFDGSRYEGSLSKMTYKYGFFKVESRFKGFESKIDQEGYTMQAGFGAYRKEYFLKLGGFDALYLPGTVEDTDICYRAWKSGYECFYVPKSVLYHKGQATFKKTFGRARLLAINQRNMYLFIWKNIQDPAVLWTHTLWLLPRPIFFLLKGRFEFLWGFFWALLKFPEAMRRRAVERLVSWKRTNPEILRIAEGI